MCTIEIIMVSIQMPLLSYKVLKCLDLLHGELAILFFVLYFLQTLSLEMYNYF